MCRTYTISSLSEATVSLVFGDEDDKEEVDDIDDNAEDAEDAEDAEVETEALAEALAEACSAELCGMCGLALRRDDTERGKEKSVELMAELSVGSGRRSAGLRLRHLP